MVDISALVKDKKVSLGWFGLALIGLGILSVLIIPWPWYGVSLVPLVYTGSWAMMKASME